jgi:anion-transporting  ArsA/GET3 family ATPase
MTTNTKRLYIVTGKGGVGKTTLSIALAKLIQSKGKKVLYNSFMETPDLSLLKSAGVDCFDLKLHESAEIYIGRKLNSRTIASWIMKTHFFKSLFQMIPGLSHMIFLGHIIDELEKNPELTIVLDSPASGHALTMFESSSNFKKIFRAGLIVKDIDRMHRFMANATNVKTIIVSLATELSIAEAQDLERELTSQFTDMELNLKRVINDSFLELIKREKISENDLPDFLKLKIEFEKEHNHELLALPHYTESNEVNLIDKISNDLGEVL